MNSSINFLLISYVTRIVKTRLHTEKKIVVDNSATINQCEIMRTLPSKTEKKYICTVTNENGSIFGTQKKSFIKKKEENIEYATHGNHKPQTEKKSS